jgi:hypothetical protein
MAKNESAGTLLAYATSQLGNNDLALQPAETQPNGVFCTLKGYDKRVIGPKSTRV